MMRIVRSTIRSHDILRFGSAVALTIAVAGCSADIARFDSTSFSFNDGNGSATASIPTPPANVYAHNGGDTWSGPAGSGGRVPPLSRADSRADSDVQVSELSAPASPPRESRTPYRSPTPSYGSSAASSAPSYAEPTPAYPSSRPSYAARTGDQPPRRFPDNRSLASAEAGDTIEVRQGDTLYALSRRHNVSVAELMSANGMSGTDIRPGQQLHLPTGSTAASSPSPRYTETAALQPISPALAAKYDGGYTVRPGDSVYSIARQFNVPLAELQQANAIIDVRKVRPGTVLRVPSVTDERTVASASDSPPPPPPPAARERPAPAPVSDDPSPAPIASTTQPTLLNGDNSQRVAALDERRATDAASASPPQPKSAPASAPEPETQAVSIAPPQPESKTPVAPRVDVASVKPASVVSGDGLKLRWPVRGRVIAEFGQRSDGTHNDGINLAVPLGSEVHAAEGGVVAYAGSELKGYGNLILVRHDNGWVTAYAHNDEMMVKRGDKVHRGQVIAKAGKTGTVDQPQLHFELRQGAKPVDPTPFMTQS